MKDEKRLNYRCFRDQKSLKKKGISAIKHQCIQTLR